MANPPTSHTRATGLLESILEEARSVSPGDELRAARTPEEVVRAWLRTAGERPKTVGELLLRISRDVGLIDDVVTRQVNAILHHPRFQKLEASWRGLEFLVDGVPEGANVRVRVLDASWQELVRDVDRAMEFDQSQLFRKVYSEEYGVAGGAPFSVLLGDYEIRPRPAAGHSTDDMSAVRGISQVAAAAFAPFVTAAHPAMLGVDEFGELERPMNVSGIYGQPEFRPLRSLRATEDSRFVGLVMPRVLVRRPWFDGPGRDRGFRCFETGGGLEHEQYLWGTAVYAYGSVLCRTFAETGWLADIRGVRRNEVAGGVVTELPVRDFGVDAPGVASSGSTDVLIGDALEDDLAAVGLIALCPCRGTDWSAFYSHPSLQLPRVYDRQDATANALISSMMPYVLCVSRFAHYLKVMCRDKVGSFAEASDVQRFLDDWLRTYVIDDPEATLETKARYPLREARIEIHEMPGQPGSYGCVVELRPHFQLDDLASTIQLVTQLTRAAG